MESHGFDFTSAMRRLCADMTRRLPELGHIQLDRVALNLCRARKRVPHGIYAALTPLRFQDGARQAKQRGRRYRVDPVHDSAGQEYLYLLSFYLPRFMDTTWEEKLSTILHELWHISPDFNGDLRRHAGRCYAHGSSQRSYNAHMDRLAQKWLAHSPPEHLYDFLLCGFDQLVAEHGPITGTHWPAPKLVPL